MRMDHMHQILAGGKWRDMRQLPTASIAMSCVQAFNYSHIC